MKAFNRIFAVVIMAIVAVFATANAVLLPDPSSGRPYRVEISRLVRELEANGLDSIDLSGCEYVTGITRYSQEFYNSDSDYVIREIGGELYRFDYQADGSAERRSQLLIVNATLGVMTAMMLAVMLYIRVRILKPFEKLTDVPYELSKGNLTTPIREMKNRFFGRFLWGVDMLRENMEQQKERELNLQKDRKMLLLSLSHDIKTPLSAIKLYSKALSRGLYDSEEKQAEIAESINAKADEIEGYVSQIITASREDFLSLDVNMGEFYLSALVSSIDLYYTEKLALIHTEFSIGCFADCLLQGDFDRSIEVLQNVMENAIKYSDGKRIEISFSEEDGCILVSVTNSGCTLTEGELLHMFNSFWRGANAETTKGSGLGLYICRQLMHKMNGEIFAKLQEDRITVSAVFAKV